MSNSKIILQVQAGTAPNNTIYEWIRGKKKHSLLGLTDSEAET